MSIYFQCEPTLLPEPNHVMLNHLYALSIKVRTTTYCIYQDIGCHSRYITPFFQGLQIQSFLKVVSYILGCIQKFTIEGSWFTQQALIIQFQE